MCTLAAARCPPRHVLCIDHLLRHRASWAQVVWGDVLAKLLTENARNRALKVDAISPARTAFAPSSFLMLLHSHQDEAYVNTSLYCLPNTSYFREALINLEQ